ncbi:MAG: FHA domain-containing protein [Acidobacteriota bacterium]
MTRLVDTSSDRSELLRTAHLVGRSERADLQLDDPRVSSEHASLRWTGRSWQVRDLGSRNGTWVDGTRLESGGSAALCVGTLLSFGHDGADWELADDAAPTLRALHLTSGTVRHGKGDLLALPDDDDPQLCVVADPDGTWLVESADDSRPATDGELLTVVGESWRLDLPHAVERTADASAEADATDLPTLDDLTFDFRVSTDEEHVEVSVSCGPHRWELGARAHHYLLLTLARLRLRDRDDTELPSTSRGWVAQVDLQKMLGYSTSGLHVAIFRARRELADLGIQSSADVVERRRQAGQVRLGVESLHVHAV